MHKTEFFSERPLLVEGFPLTIKKGDNDTVFYK